MTTYHIQHLLRSPFKGFEMILPAEEVGEFLAKFPGHTFQITTLGGDDRDNYISEEQSKERLAKSGDTIRPTIYRDVSGTI